jgi:phosphoribosylformylglycinamidine synthase
VRIEIYSLGGPLDGDVVVLPPGLARDRAPEALEALRTYARAGGRLLGLGDGVAWLCAASLLPGAVDADEIAARPTHVRVEGRATAFTWAIPAGRILAVPPLPPRARFVAPDDEIAELAARGRIVLRYCDAAGGVHPPRAGGHAATVAGVSDESGRVVGLVAPSPAELDTELGRQLVTCLRAAPRAATAAAAARRLAASS